MIKDVVACPHCLCSGGTVDLIASHTLMISSEFKAVNLDINGSLFERPLCGTSGSYIQLPFQHLWKSGSIVRIMCQGELLISQSTLNSNSYSHSLHTSADGNSILPPPQIKNLEIIFCSSFSLKSHILFLSNPPGSLYL